MIDRNGSAQRTYAACRFVELALLLTIVLPSAADGEFIWVKYDANLTTLELPPSDPLTFGWFDSLMLPFAHPPHGQLVTDPLAGRMMQAWQITEPAQEDVLLNYSAAWDSMAQVPQPMIDNGWRLHTVARYIDNLQGAASQGLLAFYDDRRYEVKLNFDSSGRLQAFIETTPGQEQLHVLTSIAEASNYHNLELRYDPLTNMVSFLFDGEPVHTWNGVALVHPPRFLFGTIEAGGAGIMNYTEATFAILDPPATPTEQGDFNDDGIVNLADYTVWRDHLGSTTQLAADGNGNGRIDAGDYTVWKDNWSSVISSSGTLRPGELIPEPPTAAMVWFAGCVLAAVCNKRVGMRAYRPF